MEGGTSTNSPTQQTQLFFYDQGISPPAGWPVWLFPRTRLRCISPGSPGFHSLPLPTGDAAECGDDDAEGGAGPAARRCRGQGGERTAPAGHQGPRRGHRQVSATNSQGQPEPAPVQCHGRRCFWSGFLLLCTASVTKGCLGFAGVGKCCQELGSRAGDAKGRAAPRLDWGHLGAFCEPRLCHPWCWCQSQQGEDFRVPNGNTRSTLFVTFFFFCYSRHTALLS